MKKILVLTLLAIVLFILDNVLMPFFAIKTFYPSALLIFIICYSIINGKWEGLWLGVFAGLLQDIYFSQGFGINGFTNMIICVIAGIVGDSIFKEKKIIPVISCFLLALFKGILVLALLYLHGIYVDVGKIFFISIYDAVLGIFMYRFIYNLCSKEYMQVKWRF